MCVCVCVWSVICKVEGSVQTRQKRIRSGKHVRELHVNPLQGKIDHSSKSTAITTDSDRR